MVQPLPSQLSTLAPVPCPVTSQSPPWQCKAPAPVPRKVALQPPSGQLNEVSQPLSLKNSHPRSVQWRVQSWIPVQEQTDAASQSSSVTPQPRAIPARANREMAMVIFWKRFRAGISAILLDVSMASRPLRSISGGFDQSL